MDGTIIAQSEGQGGDGQPQIVMVMVPRDQQGNFNNESIVLPQELLDATSGAHTYILAEDTGDIQLANGGQAQSMFEVLGSQYQQVKIEPNVDIGEKTTNLESGTTVIEIPSGKSHDLDMECETIQQNKSVRKRAKKPIDVSPIKTEKQEIEIKIEPHSDDESMKKPRSRIIKPIATRRGRRLSSKGRVDYKKLSNLNSRSPSKRTIEIRELDESYEADLKQLQVKIPRLEDTEPGKIYATGAAMKQEPSSSNEEDESAKEDSPMKMDIPTLLSIKKLAPVEYEVMDGASMRGRPKLFDSLGYAYNLRRTEDSHSYWACCIRSPRNTCPARVKQTNDEFKMLSKRHNHAPTPDAALKAKLSRDIRSRAVNEIDKSALHIVRDAIRDHLGDSTEHDSILRHTQYLVNNANYARKILKRKQLLSATPEERQAAEEAAQKAAEAAIEASKPDTTRQYQVVQGSSSRGAEKLFDSDGFSYTTKKRYTHCVWWRCSVRNNNINCPASVKQQIEKHKSIFYRGREDHIHNPQPGAETKALIASKLRQRIKYNIDSPASAIVNAVKEELGLETVETAIKQEYLVRKVNYAKKKLRDSGFVSVDGAAVEAEVITETTIPSEENYWGFDMDDDDDEDKAMEEDDVLEERRMVLTRLKSRLDALETTTMERFEARQASILRILRFCISGLEQLQEWALFAIFPLDESNGDAYLQFVQHRFQCISGPLKSFIDPSASTKPPTFTMSANGMTKEQDIQFDDNVNFSAVPGDTIEEKIRHIANTHMADAFDIKEKVIHEVQMCKRGIRVVYRWCQASLVDLGDVIDDVMADELFYLTRGKLTRLLSAISMFEEASVEIDKNLVHQFKDQQFLPESGVVSLSLHETPDRDMKEGMAPMSQVSPVTPRTAKSPKPKESLVPDMRTIIADPADIGIAQLLTESYNSVCSRDSGRGEEPSTAGSSPEPPQSPRPVNLINHPKIIKVKDRNYTLSLPLGELKNSSAW